MFREYKKEYVKRVPLYYIQSPGLMFREYKKEYVTKI